MITIKDYLQGIIGKRKSIKLSKNIHNEIISNASVLDKGKALTDEDIKNVTKIIFKSITGMEYDDCDSDEEIEILIEECTDLEEMLKNEE